MLRMNCSVWNFTRFFNIKWQLHFVLYTWNELFRFRTNRCYDKQNSSLIILRRTSKSKDFSFKRPCFSRARFIQENYYSLVESSFPFSQSLGCIQIADTDTRDRRRHLSTALEKGTRLKDGSCEIFLALWTKWHVREQTVVFTQYVSLPIRCSNVYAARITTRKSSRDELCSRERQLRAIFDKSRHTDNEDLGSIWNRCFVVFSEEYKV